MTRSALESAAVAYAAEPGPDSGVALELAATRSTIDRVLATGERFPAGAMLLLEQLASDPCRCGSDAATCSCTGKTP